MCDSNSSRAEESAPAASINGHGREQSGSENRTESEESVLPGRSTNCVRRQFSYAEAGLGNNGTDMVLADLGGRGWLVYRRGLGGPDLRAGAWRSFLGDRPVIEVTDVEAERLACNVLLVGRTAVAGWLSRRLVRRIEGLGFTVAVCPMEEFAKAGAGPHCLAAEL